MKHPPQEHDIVPGRRIAAVGLGVIATTVAGAWIAYGIARWSARDLGAGAADRAAPRTSPEVNAMERTLFATEAQGLELHRLAEAYLATYGWVDRDREIVHVPLAVAVEIYLARRRAAGSQP
jgi:hypothetical protein